MTTTALSEQNKQTKNSLTLLKHSSHSSYTVVMLTVADLFITIITIYNFIAKCEYTNCTRNVL